MTPVDIARKDTICAPATPTGRSALAVIRVSGPDSWEMLQRVFYPRHAGPIKPFVATLGQVKGSLDDQAAASSTPLHEQPTVDEAVCVAYPAGRSYTGEASFELSTHGNPLLVQAVLQLLQRAGCRLAQPGEFSLRAVLSGKLDLCQAQGVYDVIHARTLRACQAALHTLTGGLSEQLQQARIHLIEALSLLEAQLDFPDDVDPSHVENIQKNLQLSKNILYKLIAGAAWGMRLQTGVRVVLCGAPNAGKSTLLNALVNEQKALVHERPGTTRDVIEAAWQLEGIPITLVDVAGLRDETQADAVERMGMQQAHKQLRAAHVVLWLVDGSTAHKQQIPRMHPALAQVQAPVIALRSKADLCTSSPDRCAGRAATARAADNKAADAMWISAHTAWGIDRLKERLRQLLMQADVCEQDPLLTSEQQLQLVQQAHQAIIQGRQILEQNGPHEVAAALLHEAGQALDDLQGSNLNEEVLDTIFSRFCIGK